MIKLPAVRLTSLLEAMELRKDTQISMKAPFTNLQNIFNGRSLIPLPTTDEEEQQEYNTESNERTVTSGPSSSSFDLPHPPSFIGAPALFLRIGTWQV